jgi:integrase
MIKVPRLKQNRHGVYCLRVYQREGGKLVERQHSLGTKNASRARLLALAFNIQFEQQRAMIDTASTRFIDSITTRYKLDLGRGIMESSDAADHALMMQAIERYEKLYGQKPPIQEAMGYKQGQTFTPPKAQQPKAPIAHSMSFSKAIAAYLEEKKLDNAPQTIIEKGRTFKDFADIYGDLEINLYTKAEVVTWKSLDLKRGLGANRINKRLGQVNDFFNWAIAHGHYTAHPSSPVEGLFVSSKAKLAAKTESYELFTNDELTKIFSAGYIDKFHKPDFYWLPIVALFTGARREELAALLAADIKTVDDVPTLFIPKGKTPDARRLIPLHPVLLSLGFMDYAKHIQDMGEAYLFPYLLDGANGRGKNAGRHFSNWLTEMKITSSRKVFHSFRHTVITRLHATGANPAHVMQIAGHSGESKGVHFETYTHDVGLQALAETLGRLSYKLDFESLKLPDPTFSKFYRLWQMKEARQKHREKLAKKASE